MKKIIRLLVAGLLIVQINISADDICSLLPLTTIITSSGCIMSFITACGVRQYYRKNFTHPPLQQGPLQSEAQRDAQLVQQATSSKGLHYLAIQNIFVSVGGLFLIGLVGEAIIAAGYCPLN